MELLRQIEGPRRSLDEIRELTQEIHDVLLAESKSVCEENFTSIHSNDLEHLFNLYDEFFFNSELGPATRRNNTPLTFRISKRMTRVGGTTTRYRHHQKRGPRWSYEIAISSTLLFSTFHDVNRTIEVTGIECRNRVEALLRIFEHELIHLTEMVAWGDSSCSQSRFQTLAFRHFAHTEATHQLITPSERAAHRFGIRPGDRVQFRVDGSRYEGFVNRITRRATVLVEDQNSPLYSDGKHYAKFYVPLSLLVPIAAAGPDHRNS
ncbi:MAG: hypothetical protein VB858_08735 [Planctomycetaceae bacterium]